MCLEVSTWNFDKKLNNLSRCLNGIIPTNKHGYHVSIKCDKARWWANDPCIADLCKVEPVINNCPRGNLPHVPYGDWECSDGNVGSAAKPGTICTLACDNGKHRHHAYGKTNSRPNSKLSLLES